MYTYILSWFTYEMCFRFQNPEIIDGYHEDDIDYFVMKWF